MALVERFYVLLKNKMDIRPVVHKRVGLRQSYQRMNGMQLTLSSSRGTIVINVAHIARGIRVEDTVMWTSRNARHSHDLLGSSTGNSSWNR